MIAAPNNMVFSQGLPQGGIYDRPQVNNDIIPPQVTPFVPPSQSPINTLPVLGDNGFTIPIKGAASPSPFLPVRQEPPIIAPQAPQAQPAPSPMGPTPYSGGLANFGDSAKLAPPVDLIIPDRILSPVQTKAAAERNPQPINWSERAKIAGDIYNQMKQPLPEQGMYGKVIDSPIITALFLAAGKTPPAAFRQQMVSDNIAQNNRLAADIASKAAGENFGLASWEAQGGPEMRQTQIERTGVLNDMDRFRKSIESGEQKRAEDIHPLNRAKIEADTAYTKKQTEAIGQETDAAARAKANRKIRAANLLAAAREQERMAQDPNYADVKSEFLSRAQKYREQAQNIMGDDPLPEEPKEDKKWDGQSGKYKFRIVK